MLAITYDCFNINSEAALNLIGAGAPAGRPRRAPARRLLPGDARCAIFRPMQLVGMLDSPYVRRVAVTLLHLGVPFEHVPISLFRHIDQFSAINPVLKAPTLVADDGTALMESGLILDHVATLASNAAALRPRGPAARLQAMRVEGLALALCEKAVQLHYERALRPPEKRHEPWAARVRGQMEAALGALEAEAAKTAGWLFEAALGRADIALACGFGFACRVSSDPVDPLGYPELARFCARAEALPAFRAAPPQDAFKAPSTLAAA